MTSGHDVSENLDPLGLVKSYFFKFFEKNKKIEKKNLGAPTSPEDKAICLFAGLVTLTWYSSIFSSLHLRH